MHMTKRMWLTSLMIGAVMVSGCGDDEAGQGTAASPTATATATGAGTTGREKQSSGERNGKEREAQATPTASSTPVSLPTFKKPKGKGNKPVDEPAGSVRECLKRGAAYGPDLQEETTALCNADPAQGLTATPQDAGDRRLLAEAAELRQKGDFAGAAAKSAEICVRQMRRRLKASAVDEGIALCKKIQQRSAKTVESQERANAAPRPKVPRAVRKARQKHGRDNND